MTRQFEAIVLGGDVDGLVAATAFAAVGRKVMLIEESEALGGSLRSIEFARGFRAAPLAQAAQRTIVALGQGQTVIVHASPERTAEGLARHSARDAQRWPAFARSLDALAGFLGELYRQPPPRIEADTLGELFSLAGLARRYRKLGRDGMFELLRTLPIPICDLLDDEFETTALKGALAAYAVADVAQGPAAAGTAFTFLHRHFGALERASAQDVPTLERQARGAGVTIETNTKVRSLAVSEGRLTGVVLESGEELSCPTVVSSLDPYRSLLELVDPRQHDPEFMHAVRNIRFRGVATRVLLALDGLPELPKSVAGNGAGDLRTGTFTIAPSIRYVEKAYEASKYGRCSDDPFVELQFPTVANPELAPHGKHVAILHVQYTPYRLREGTWPQLGATVAERALARVEDVLPGFGARVLERKVLTPLDLETQFGVREGAVSQGEMMLDQILFMRPVPAASRYATPIEGYFLCGAGTHPGAGVHGTSGRLAARAAMSVAR